MPAANMMIAKISVMLPADSLPKSSAPKKPPASTPKPTAMNSSASKYPLNRYMMPLAKLMGRMTRIAVACDTFVGFCSSEFKSGTAIMPPPPPNTPFTAPVKIPLKISNIFCFLILPLTFSFLFCTRILSIIYSLCIIVKKLFNFHFF